MHNIKRWEEMEVMRDFDIFFWLCSMAQHIKLGSNPSSHYLPHLLCCYILYIFFNSTHMNIIHRYIDDGSYANESELLLANKKFNLDDLGQTPHQERKKKIEFMEIMNFGLDIGDKRRESMQCEVFMRRKKKVQNLSWLCSS